MSKPKRSSLYVHALLAGGVLVLLSCFTGPRVAFFSDEGAGAIQAELFSEGRASVAPLPKDVDPARLADNFPAAVGGEKADYPYLKHPLYPVFLALPVGLGGATGAMIVSIVGTVLAALGTGALAKRSRLVSPPVALWATALATPLFFDSYLALAHTAATAAVVFAALGAMGCLQRVTKTKVVCTLVPAALACALRTEAALVVGGLALATLLVPLRRRRRPERASIGLGLAMLAVPVVVRLGERAVEHSVLGSPVHDDTIGSSVGWLAGRWSAFVTTFLRPGIYGDPADRWLVLGALLVAMAAIATRFDRAKVAVVILIAAAGSYLGWVVIRQEDFVPGLMLVCPLAAGLLVITRQDLSSDDSYFLSIALVTSSVGILATQYPDGGGVEWGGRYFAVIVPFIVLLGVPGVVRMARKLPRRFTRLACASSISIAVCLAAASLQTLRMTHENTRLLQRRIAVLGSGFPAGRQPTIVTSYRLLPQILWTDYFAYRWVTPPSRHLASISQRLAEHSEGPVIGVLLFPDDEEILARHFRIVRRDHDSITLVLLTPK